MMLVVNAPEGSNGGGQSTRKQFGSLSVFFWFGPQQGDNMLQGAGGLQTQSIHHVAQIVCGTWTEGVSLKYFETHTISCHYL